MPSKQATDKIRDANLVLAAFDTLAVTAGKALADRLTPELAPTEAMPDLALLLRLVGRTLQRDTDALAAADEAHQVELGDDARPRDARDLAAAALADHVVQLRAEIEAGYGARALAKLNVRGVTPRDPLALSRFAADLANALERNDLGPPVKEKFAVDVPAEVAALRAQVAEIELHLRVVATEAKEAELTLVAKNAAIATYDDTFSRTAGFLSAALRLARVDDHAERVRPSARGGGRLANPVPEPTAPPTAEGTVDPQ